MDVLQEGVENMDVLQEGVENMDVLCVYKWIIKSYHIPYFSALIISTDIKQNMSKINKYM